MHKQTLRVSLIWDYFSTMVFGATPTAVHPLANLRCLWASCASPTSTSLATTAMTPRMLCTLPLPALIPFPARMVPTGRLPTPPTFRRASKALVTSWSAACRCEQTDAVPLNEIYLDMNHISMEKLQEIKRNKKTQLTSCLSCCDGQSHYSLQPRRVLEAFCNTHCSM